MSLMPPDFTFPTSFDAAGYRGRLLGVADIAPHAAAHSTAGAGFASCTAPGGRPWPGTGVRTALAHLGYCEWEHYRRSSAWYGVFDADGAETGGLAIVPSYVDEFDAGLATWSREGPGTEADAAFFAAAKAWLREAWPLERVGFPGREHPWAAFAPRSLVAADFAVPEAPAFEGLRIRLLTIDDVARDYAAYMSNIAHIRGTLQGPSFSAGWPHAGIRLDLAFADMCWSEWQHAVLREQFSFGVFTAYGTAEVGCLYLSSTDRADFGVEITFWFVEGVSATGIEVRFPAFVRGWLREAWGFERPAFPGREIPWDAWLTAEKPTGPTG